MGMINQTIEANKKINNQTKEEEIKHRREVTNSLR